MNKPIFKRQFLSVLLCLVLIAVTALTLTGCTESTPSGTTTTSTTASTAATTASPTRVGLGDKTFYFHVVDKDGNETRFEVLTEDDYVGGILQNLDLIRGEQGPYGLYVKTVNGITLDYDADGMYWAFYVNGTYATTGVDTTPVEDGATYTFKAES